MQIFTRSKLSKLQRAVIFVYLTLESCQLLECSYSDFTEMKNNLLRGYEKSLRPSVNDSTPTSVNVVFEVQYVVKMDERNGILTFKGMLILAWQDNRLRWKQKPPQTAWFSGKQIWIPEVSVISSAQNSDLMKQNGLALVHHNGEVRMFSQVQIDIPCSVNNRNFPIQEGSCSFKLGSETSDGHDVSLMAFDFPLEYSDKETYSEWRILNASCTNQIHSIGEPFNYSMVVVRLRVQRIALPYWYMFVATQVTSCLLTVSGFLLGFSDIRRYVVAGLGLLVTFFAALCLVMIVPFREELPVIVAKAVAFLVLSCVFVLETAVLSLSERFSTTPPKLLQRGCRFAQEKLLCLEVGPPTDRPSDPFEARTRRPWDKIAAVVDLFILFAFLVAHVVLLSIAT